MSFFFSSWAISHLQMVLCGSLFCSTPYKRVSLPSPLRHASKMRFSSPSSSRNLIEFAILYCRKPLLILNRISICPLNSYLWIEVWTVHSVVSSPHGRRHALISMLPAVCVKRIAPLWVALIVPSHWCKLDWNVTETENFSSMLCLNCCHWLWQLQISEQRHCCDGNQIRRYTRREANSINCIFTYSRLCAEELK